MRLWIYLNTFSSLGFASAIKLGLSSSLVQLGLEYELTEDPGLLMDSNIEFSSKIALCIQLTQSTNELKHFIEKKLSVPKTTFKSTSTVTSVQPSAGVSHLLNAKNNEMCSKILSWKKHHNVNFEQDFVILKESRQLKLKHSQIKIFYYKSNLVSFLLRFKFNSNKYLRTFTKRIYIRFALWVSFETLNLGNGKSMFNTQSTWKR